jgi:recombination protein RecA
MRADSLIGRSKALRAAVEAIERQFGKGAITSLGDGPTVAASAVSTGSLSLDRALGIGGYPRGRLVEVFGPESSGKTTLALHAIAEVQRLGGTAAFLDAEHALDVAYAARLGVQCPSLLLAQPDCGEQGLEVCDLLVSSGAVDLVVIDSVAALVPRAEIEGQMGDQHVGAQARMMSQAMRKLARSTHQSQAIVLFINQLRQKIGVAFGNPETTTGGNALKFFASVRVEVRRLAAIKHDGQVVGNRTRLKVVKNKLAPPFREAEVDVVYGLGIDRTAELIDLAVAAGLVDKSGAWYSLADGGERIGQGRDGARAWLEAHDDVADTLRARLRGGDGAGDGGGGGAAVVVIDRPAEPEDEAA